MRRKFYDCLNDYKILPISATINLLNSLKALESKRLIVQVMLRLRHKLAPYVSHNVCLILRTGKCYLHEVLHLENVHNLCIKLLNPYFERQI